MIESKKSQTPSRRQWLGATGAMLLGLQSLPVLAGPVEDFFKAVELDNPSAVMRALLRGMDPNVVSARGQYGLTLALKEDSLKAFDTLLQSPRTNVNVENTLGETPLMLAAIRGHLDAVKRLIARGADVNKVGWTPLHYACSAGPDAQVAIIQLLLEESAYIDAASPNGTTPLMMAAQYGKREAVQLLIAEGADASIKNQQGQTARDFAVRSERDEVVKWVEAAARTQRRSTGTW